jgi:hypothetical protein
VKVSEAIQAFEKGKQAFSKIERAFRIHCESQDGCNNCKYNTCKGATCKGVWMDDNKDLELG